MTISQLFTQANYTYRGSDDDAPVAGTSDFTMWLNVANRKLHEYSQGENWISQFDTLSVGTVSAGTQAYDLDDTILLPADKVTVTKSGVTSDYQIVKPQERDRFSNAVYISGQDPQKLTFCDTITATDPIVGGTISIAAYYAPDDFTGANDTVEIDDVYWMVYALASDLASNELTYAAKAANLQAQANNLWKGMVRSNRRGTNNNPRIVRTNVSRIPGTSTTSVGNL